MLQFCGVLVQEHVHHLVELMAGEASRNLTEDVTHLVAGEVGSQKYAVSTAGLIHHGVGKILETPPPPPCLRESEV